MRIAYVSEVLSIHDYRFLKKMVDNHYDVHLYAMRVGIPEAIASLKNITISRPDFYRDEAKPRSWLQRKYDYWRAIGDLKQWLIRIKPDILHAGWVTGSGYISALSGFHPFVLMPWGSDVLIEAKQSLFGRNRAKTAIKRADAITCDCQEVKKALLSIVHYPEDRISVFPWGIDLGLFNSDHRERAQKIRADLGWQKNKIMIMDRSFEPVYGHQYFINALTEVFASCEEARVILVGEGAIKVEISKMAAKLGLSDKIMFAGRVRNEELPAYLCASDIYVSTSLSDGTSLSLLEAMACGLPAVVTDVPANLEWIVDDINGYIAPRGDRHLLAKKLILMLNNNGKSKIFGQTNRTIVREKADWDKNFRKLEIIYRSLIDRKVVKEAVRKK
jgi:L-malate glycosyltransferase